MYYPNAYVKYNSWRDKKVNEILDDATLTDEEYEKAISELTFDNFLDQLIDRSDINE